MLLFKILILLRLEPTQDLYLNVNTVLKLFVERNSNRHKICI